MNKRATYCQKVHYMYISQKHSHLKMNSDASCMKCITYTSVTGELYYITAKKLCRLLGELIKTRKCRSISHGLYE